MGQLLFSTGAAMGKWLPTPALKRRRLTVLLSALAVTVAFALAWSVSSASAHSWSGWHWDRGGSYIPIYIWNYAGTSTTADRARADIHARPHPIYLYNTNQHTNISVFDENAPSANYCGLAEIIDWYWSFPWQYHISHAHARYNTACGGNGGTGANYAQGVYCQEIGHTLGLDHSDTGDCMGLGYFSGSSSRFCFGISCNTWEASHPARDLYDMYRYH